MKKTVSEEVDLRIKKNSMDDPTALQSDILEESKADMVSNEMFNERQGPSSRKKSSQASSSVKSYNTPNS